MSNILVARKGYVYTDGITYGHTVILGSCDSAENWHEITEEEYQAIMKEQEETAEGV